ncbi:hypothetical protein CPB86DRAFT_773481 [Serendipita vermifera]|nr:hypothetical protein CPB86DRAFT_773481 [Serendipita vermifera]
MSIPSNFPFPNQSSLWEVYVNEAVVVDSELVKDWTSSLNFFLGVSIIAASASVVALQWVAEYDAAVSRSGSSPEDRVRRRQFRYSGMEKWKMKEIIAALPVLLYCSLILFFAGLAQWMWSIHTTVGIVVLGGTLICAAFYLFTTVLAVAFPHSVANPPPTR